MISRRIATLLAFSISLTLAAKTRADTPISHFTPGDYVVLRGGDTTDSESSFQEVPAYLDEFDPAGNYVGTLPIPSSGNGQLTIAGVQSTDHEGVLNISPNGQWITFAGYQYDPNTNASGAVPNPLGVPQPNRVVGEVSVTAASLNTTTVVNAYPANYVRTALTFDGNEFLVAGKFPDGGLQYVSGTGPSATTTSLQPDFDWRNIEYENGVLYGSTGSSSTGVHGVHMIGPLPTLAANQVPKITPANNSLITNYPGGNSSTDAAFLNIPTADPNALSQNNLNVLYSISDQHGNLLTKYYFDGTLWQPAGGSPLTSDIATITSNPTGIIAKQDPTNPAWVDLLVSGTNGVFTYIDKSADPTLGISTNNPSPSMSLLFAPQDPNEAFYGLTLAPQLLGDANLDGNVDLTDLSIVLNNFGKSTSAWTDGNFDHQPTIDLTDLSDVLNNFGQSLNLTASASLHPAATAAPEPASLAILSLSSLLLIKRRR